MDFNIIEEKMKKTISVFEENLAEVRAGRANPNILNKVTVDYYGVPTPINQMAGISVQEPRTIVIQPWDMSILKDIEKAIENSLAVLHSSDMILPYSLRTEAGSFMDLLFHKNSNYTYLLNEDFISK